MIVVVGFPVESRADGLDVAHELATFGTAVGTIVVEKSIHVVAVFVLGIFLALGIEILAFLGLLPFRFGVIVVIRAGQCAGEWASAEFGG